MVVKDVDDILMEGEEAKPSVVAKILLGIVAVFLIFLIVSYVLVDPSVLDIFEGLVESERLNVTTMEVVMRDGRVVRFEREAYNQLTSVYLENERHEFKACLGGEVDGASYVIKKVVIPETIEQSVFHVRAVECPSEALVVLHSHPYKRCVASAQDVNNLRAFQERNADAVMMVMCETDRFSIYT